METQQRTRLSSSFIVLKLFFIAVVIAFLLAMYSHRDSVDNKTIIAFAILSAVFGAFIIYLFTRPVISYDAHDLFIKSIGSGEVAIPLKDIKSVTRGYAYKGSSTYTIKYTANRVQRSIKLSKNYPSKTMSAFIACVKQNNSSLQT